MGLKAKYATQEEIPEALRENYKEFNGAWVLELDGGDDIPSLKGALDKEKNDHRTAKQKAEAEAAAKAELAKKLELYEGLGDFETVQKMIEEAKKGQPPPKVEDLQAQLKKKTDELRALEGWKKQFEPEYNTLKENYAKEQKKADLADAKTVIESTVAGMKGVFGGALTTSLFAMYKAGDLIRSDAGEIVAQDGTPIVDFAPAFAKKANLYQPSVSSGGKPPEAPAAPQSKAALQKSLNEAIAKGDTDAVQKIKIQLYSQEEK